MPWDGNGNFNRDYNWVTDKANAVPVTASRMDGEFDNFKQGLENCLTRDGQNAMAAPLRLGGQRITELASGSASSPAIYFNGDMDTGLYRPDADQIGWAAGGAARLLWNGTSLELPGGQMEAPDGSDSAPTYSFSSELDSGLYLEAPGKVGISVLGTLCFSIDDSGIAEATTWAAGDGSAGAPAFTFAGDTDTGIFRPGDNIFAIATGGQERLRVDENGNVGIGLASAGGKLEVSAGTGSEDTLRLYRPRSDIGIGLGRLRWDGQTSDGARAEYGNIHTRIVDNSPAQPSGEFVFCPTYEGNQPIRMRITGTGDWSVYNRYNFEVTTRNSSANESNLNIRSLVGSAASIGFSEAGAQDRWAIGFHGGSPDLVFASGNNRLTLGTERMRLTGTGHLLVGKNASGDTSAGIELRQTGEVVINRSGIGFYLGRTGDGQVALFRHNGSSVGSISVTASGTAYNMTSDYRLKENVVPLTGALDRLGQIPVYRFNFINDPERTVDGFLAHQVQAVVAEAVTGEKDAVDEDGNIIPQQIDQSKLVPLITAAVQELKARVEMLEQAA